MNHARQSLSTGRSRQYQHVNITGGNVVMGDVLSAGGLPTPEVEQAREQAILDALKYENMTAREEQLDQEKFSPSSFEWVWTTAFAEWLEKGDSFFWIAGKPASGKSTLMAFLARDQTTRRHLCRDGQKWEIVKFFYDFRAGTSTANQTEGMIRSLLFQLANLLAIAMGDLVKSHTQQPLPHMNLGQLTELVCSIVGKSETRICAFVDGLDEYDGDACTLLEVLEDIKSRSGLKICLASRQIHPFNDLLEGYPRIEMQMHNEVSMRTYIRKAIIKASSTCLDAEHKFSEQLRVEIIEKSQGVMLWTKLVVDELLDVAQDAESSEDLLKVLSKLPLELEDLYQRVLNKLNPTNRSEAAIILHIILSDGAAADVLELIGILQYLGQQNLGLSPYGKLDPGQCRSRLSRLLKPLIDFTSNGVRLMHKTLAAYLSRSKWTTLNSPPEFSTRYPDWVWLRLYNDVLKHLILDGSWDYAFSLLQADSPVFFDEWNLPALLYVKRTEPDARSCVVVLLKCLTKRMVYLLSQAENGDLNSFEIVRCLLRSDYTWLFVFKYKQEFNGPSFSDWQCLKTLVLHRESRDLVTAVIHRLPRFFAHRLKTGPPVTNNLLEDLLKIAVDWKILDTTAKSDEIIQILVDQGTHLRRSHLCVSLQFESLHHYRSPFSRQAFPNHDPDRWKGRHHDTCGSSIAHNLLYDWAKMQACYDEYTSYTQQEGWLQLLIWGGEDINLHCYPGGGIMHAIFTFCLDENHSQNLAISTKMAILIDNGLSMPSRRDLKNFKRMAQKAREKLLPSSLVHRMTTRNKLLQCQPHQKHTLMDLDVSITFLEATIKTGTWPDLTELRSGVF